MENIPPAQAAGQMQSHGHNHNHNHPPDSITPAGRKRSGSGGSILSKFPFLRTADSRASLNESRHPETAQDASSPASLHPPPRALAAISQQQKTRRRRGSLRKVALLGRGAARERRELKPLALDTATSNNHTTAQVLQPSPSGSAAADVSPSSPVMTAGGGGGGGFGLGISDATPRPSMDGRARKVAATVPSPTVSERGPLASSPTISYTTTDEEDAVLSIPVRGAAAPRPDPASLLSSSGSSDPYLRSRSSSTSIQRRRSVKHAKSPLSLQGLTASASLPAAAVDEDHDYSETEWWGWVVLVVTWFVFVIGMGSCLNVWSWAWDVGTTPYAPPELEDDPTLPIVGYYPALLILTCIMAWVWVVVAWIGMKYFRHAKISGD